MLHAAAVVVAMLLCRDDCIQALGRQESLASTESHASQDPLPSSPLKELFEMLASLVQGSSLSLFTASMQIRHARPVPLLIIWLRICIKSLYFAAQHEMQGQPSPHCAR